MTYSLIEYSIVIPTFQRCSSILNLVSSIDRLTRSMEMRDRLEVVVVVDGSKDGTYEALSSYRSTLNLSIITQENSGRSAARNKGIECSNGLYLWLLDDDMDITEYSLRSHLTRRSVDDEIFVGRIVTIAKEEMLNEALSGYYDSLHTKLLDCKNNILDPFLVSVANTSGPKRLFSQYAFSVEFGQYGLEDHELAYRLIRDNISIRYLEHAEVKHIYDHSLDKYFDLLYQEGKSRVIMHKIHADVPLGSNIGTRNPMLLSVYLMERYCLRSSLSLCIFCFSTFCKSRNFPISMKKKMLKYAVAAYRSAGIVDQKTNAATKT